MGLDYVMVVVVPWGHGVRLCNGGGITTWGHGLDYAMVMVVPWGHGVRLCNGDGCTMGAWG